MPITRVAGQIANRLEAALRRADRHKGLASMPGPEANCFSKKPSHAALSGEPPFRDIERTSFCSEIRLSQPSHR